MSFTPRLKLSYILPQQAQKHVAANESFRRLDALVQLAVKSAALGEQPAAPAEGDAYILSAGAGGVDWSLMAANAVAAFQDGQWIEFPPRAGWRAFVEDLNATRVFDGSAWVAEGASGGEATFSALGVNAAADATTKLAVRSEAALFAHDDAGTGDARLTVSKSAVSKTASVVFQDNFSGRAELGLCGGDDFSLKVSADGAVWRSAIVVKTDGKVGIGTEAPAAPLELHVNGSATAGALVSADDFLITKESGPSVFAGAVASASSGDRMVFKGTKARGTLAAPAAAAAGDSVFSLLGSVYDGAVTRATAGVEMAVDGAVSSGIAPQRIVFLTGAAATRAERARITSAGDVGVGVTAPSTKLHVDGPVRVKSYAKAALPSASTTGAGAILYVADEAGGPVIAFSDGTNWRRTTDRAVVS